ncbi:MAG: hypothetical protein ACRYG8_22705 [Janthinobacterium lividum]
MAILFLVLIIIALRSRPGDGVGQIYGIAHACSVLFGVGFITSTFGEQADAVMPTWYKAWGVHVEQAVSIVIILLGGAAYSWTQQIRTVIWPFAVGAALSIYMPFIGLLNWITMQSDTGTGLLGSNPILTTAVATASVVLSLLALCVAAYTVVAEMRPRRARVA